MCELCKCRKPANQPKLCLVCSESIRRLAEAVRAIEAGQGRALVAQADSGRR
jgi:hypothetical protein